VQEKILNYIKKWVPLRRTAMLAGNSVHADRVFMSREMPEIVDWLHYRYLGCASLHLALH
jgi:oligoribonuclease